MPVAYLILFIIKFILIAMSLDDGVLRMFIDEVFDVFDSDKNGYLDVDELHTFFNQLFAQLNEPRRFTQQQTREYMRTFDL